MRKNLNVEKGDSVDKREGKTDLTTGVVKDIKIQAIGRFRKPSPVIISPAEKTNLLWRRGLGVVSVQQCLSPEENIFGSRKSKCSNT